MPKKSFSPEQIMILLRQTEVATSQDGVLWKEIYATTRSGGPTTWWFSLNWRLNNKLRAAHDIGEH